MNRRTVLIITILIVIFGSLTKLYYIHYTETWERQHDVISFGADEGHAYYIQYLYENKALPDFDPREKWGLFQPPLHHIISATVLGVSEFFGAKEKRAQENIQIFTCIYMILVSVFAVLFYYAARGRNARQVDNVRLGNGRSDSAGFSNGRLGNARLVDIKPEHGNLNIGAAVAALVVAFHPIYILMSGSINNDALALILSVASLAIASAWYEKPSYVNTILLALAIGLAMLAKLTGGLVAVPIGILIIMKSFGFSQDKASCTVNSQSNSDIKLSKKKTTGNDLNGNESIYNDLDENKSSYVNSITFKGRLQFFVKNYLIKMCVFAAIVFPLGLYWSIRNKLKWDMPINYIPPVGENFPENTAFLSRLFDIRTKSVFPYMKGYGNEYDEFNVILLMLKSSLFGEYNYSEYGRLINLSSKILFATAIILVVLCVYATIRVMLDKSGAVSPKWKIILFGTYATYLIAYLYFALSSNNFSAGDFRYSAICILCEALFLGIYTDTKASQPTKIFTTMLCILFAGSSFVTYVMLGLRG